MNVDAQAFGHSETFGRSGPRIWAYSSSLALLAATTLLLAYPAPADEPAVVSQLSMACAVGQVTSSHKSASSDYTVTGACNLFETSRGKTSPYNAYVVDWSATGSHQPNTKATFETMTLTLVELGKVTGIATIHSTMQCGSDPWRIAPTGRCRAMTRQTAPPSLAGYLSMAYQQLLQDAPNLPLSFKLNPAQRAALEKQYQMSFATRQKPGSVGPLMDKPMGSPLSPANQAAIGAATKVVPDWPALTEPKPGARVVQGQFMVKATPPAVGGGFAAEVEFTWLDASALNPYVNTWPLSMDQLTKGIIVPGGVTRGQAGRWQVRARVSNPNKGSWSIPVPFELFLTQPTQSLQTPQPLRQSPQQGLSDTTLIRPRGIDEQGAAQRHEPVARPDEPGALR
ncbi:MAG: hypothetical protein KF814_05180 [Nitrospiraceae bacterium]|nr:hypothetical protein [Nitrospiraceae bacterium]